MKTALFLSLGLLGLIALFAATILIGRSINARKYKIRSAAGVQKSEYVLIGGIWQYLQIRGQDRSNPVILMLHGGPGSNMAYYSYAWQAHLEGAYTFVHRDQRGCGNTYYRNKNAEKPTLQLLLSDLDALVDYIRSAYGKEKVLLMGHSWGTLPGGIYAGTHPEKISAIISVSQMLDFKKSEQASAQEAARLAKAAGKAREEREINGALTAVMAYQKFGRREATAFLQSRQQKEKFLPAQYSGRMASLRLLSPYMTGSDFKWMFAFDKLIEVNSELYGALLAEHSLSIYDYSLQYAVPVIIVAGENDWTTPYPMALRYFNEISAPYKEFITIRQTGHIPFVDRPEEFSEKLLQALSAALI